MIHSRLNQEATKGTECDNTSTQGSPQRKSMLPESILETKIDFKFIAKKDQFTENKN